MRRIAIGLALTIALAIFPWQAAWGQASIGVHASASPRVEGAGGSVGFGVGGGGRLGLGIPVVGIKFLVTADVLLPDCGAVKCRLYNGSLNLLYTLPIPMVVTPYFGGGVAYQHADGASSPLGAGNDLGVNLLAGISFGSVGTFHPFGELRYQFMSDHGNLIMGSAGVSLSTW